MRSSTFLSFLRNTTTNIAEKRNKTNGMLVSCEIMRTTSFNVSIHTSITILSKGTSNEWYLVLEEERVVIGTYIESNLRVGTALQDFYFAT